MRFSSTRIRSHEVPKHKNKVKWGWLAQDEGQMMLLSTRTIANEVAKHKNKDNWAFFAQKTMVNALAKHKNNRKKGDW